MYVEIEDLRATELGHRWLGAVRIFFLLDQDKKNVMRHRHSLVQSTYCLPKYFCSSSLVAGPPLMITRKDIESIPHSQPLR